MNKKKILAFILAVAVCTTLFVSCGAKGNSSALKIGFIGPLSGDTAQYGEAVKNGADMKINEINAAGGINGFMIELIAYDSKGDATEATNAYSRLVDQDSVIAIVGPVLTGETLAVAELAADDEFPLITASATGDTITEIGTSLFRTCFKDSFQGGRMGNYVFEKLGFKKVAVLTNSGSDYSVGLTNSFVAACKEKGVEVVAQESYASGDKDFKSQLTNIASSGCEALYVPDYYEVVVLIAQQAKDTSVTVPFLGGDGYGGLVSTATDPATIEGFIFSDHYSSGAGSTAGDFAASYKTIYGTDPLSFSYLAYDAMQIYEAAIGSAPSTDKADLIAALKATDLKCLTSSYTFDADNNPIKDCMMLKVVNGENTFVEMF